MKTAADSPRPAGEAKGAGAQPPAGRARKFLLGYPMMALLLAAYWGLAVSSVHDKSPTFDEPAHLTGGYSYWVTGDYRLNTEGGVLGQRLASLPLLLQDLRFPSRWQGAWYASIEWLMAHQFFYQCHNDPQAMLWWARVLMAAVSAGLGAAIFFWSRSLFGPAGGMFSLAMFALSPAFLAYGPLAATDALSALAFLLSVGCFWRMIHRLSVARVLASGAALTMLFLGKMSAPLVLPMLLALLAVRLVRGGDLEIVVGGLRRSVAGRRRLAGALAAGVVLNAAIVFAGIWASYAFRYEAMVGAKPGRDEFDQPQYLTKVGPVQTTAKWMMARRLLPEAYLYGVVFAYERSDHRSAFLNGEHYNSGRPGFFPYCFAVKTPLSGLIVLPMAVVAGLWRRRCSTGVPPVSNMGVSPMCDQTRPGSAFGGWYSRTRCPCYAPAASIARALYDTAPLWVLLVSYWAVAITSHINLGARHLLPACGPMMVLLGVCGRWLDGPLRAAKAAAWGVLALAALECLLAWPNYLAYFNPLDGGSGSAYRHLVDSSLDWGQDLPALRQWLLDHADQNASGPVYLSYFGTGSPTWYGLVQRDDDPAQLQPTVKVRRLPGFLDMDLMGEPLVLVPLRGGTYCISATLLQQVDAAWAGPWIRSYESRYQLLREPIQELMHLPREEFVRTFAERPKYWGPLSQEFVQLRLGRLCAYLRQRQPDDTVNYSILIFRLSDSQIQQALLGPPAELLDDSCSPYVKHAR